jgi:mRNA-degrading endonuclease HigB of HigAB toxin-antitoxin module
MRLHKRFFPKALPAAVVTLVLTALFSVGAALAGAPCSVNADCGNPDLYCEKAVGACGGAGICQPMAPGSCSANYDPVCGCDGSTYSNACYAAEAGMNVLAAGACPPAGPSWITAFDGLYTDSIRLNWEDVSGEEGYRLYRAPDAGGPWTQVGTIRADLTVYNDPLPCGNLVYHYRVTAYAGSLETLPSPSDQGSTKNGAPVAEADGPYAILVGQSVDFSGTGSSDPDSSCGDSLTAFLWDLDNDGAFDDASGQVVNISWEQLGTLGIASPGQHPVRLRVVDEHGGAGTDDTTLTVIQLNRAPTDLALSPSTVAENQPGGTTVGTLSTTDPDAGDSHSYSLVSGADSGDNGSFTISGNQLRTSGSFNFESKSSYAIRIRTTDSGALSYEEALTVSVNNVNEAPIDLSLSPATIAENQPGGTTVGTLSTTDPDVGDSHSYALVSGAGGGDNASFTISGNQLRTVGSFNFESKSSYAIRIRTTDSGALSYEEALTVTVTNANEAPTDLALSPSSVAENQPGGTTVATFTTTDPDAGDSHSYALVTGSGGGDNASFTISGNQLRTVGSFNFEAKSAYAIRVRTTDGGGLWYEEPLTVTVTDANEPPTGLSLSPSSVSENEPSGTMVGSFTTTDPDAGDTFTYALVAGTGGTDNGSFTVSGDQLLTNDAFDFETKTSYAIRVRTTDAGGLWYEEAFTVAVTNDPTDSAFANIATRGKVLTGANILIGGITVAGSSPKTFIFRGLGPSLTAYGVPGALANPVIRVYSGSTMIATNDDWGALSPADRGVLSAEGLTPNHPRDSALVLTLNPGAFTLHLLGQNKGTGVGLVEVYETSLWGPVSSPDEGGMLVGDERLLELQGYRKGSGLTLMELREPAKISWLPGPGDEPLMAVSPTEGLSNIATRGKVLTGADVMIAGFTIVGGDPKTVVIRGIGPSLAAYGVPGALGNPTLRVYSGPAVIATNDNWGSLGSIDKGVLTDLSLTPAHSLEAALVLTLQPGSYTAILSGVNKGTGVGLIEVYDADRW